MKLNVVVAMFLSSLLLLSVALPSAVFGKPKKSSPQNCGIQDVQSNFGSSCVNQMEQDILKNKPYTHVLFCGGDTMLCCTVDNTTDQVINCRKPAGTRLSPGIIKVPNSGAVLSRGVDGEEESGETTPVPDWVKESWAKEQPSVEPSK